MGRGKWGASACFTMDNFWEYDAWWRRDELRVEAHASMRSYGVGLIPDTLY